MADGRQRFSLRRLNIGTVSVLIGTIFFFGAAGTASADTLPTDTSAAVTANTDQTSSSTDSQTVVLGKTASESAASTASNSASTSSVSDVDSAASSSSADSSSASTTNTLNSATVTSSAAASASAVTQSAVVSPKVNVLTASTTNSSVEIPANVARNYAGVAWTNYTDGIYSDSTYYNGKSITNGVLNISSTDPQPKNWTITLNQPSSDIPVPKFSDSDSKTYYTFASVKYISGDTEVGNYVATKNLTDNQVIVTYFEKTGDTYVQKESVQLTQGQTTTLGSVSIDYPSSIVFTPNAGSTMQLVYHYLSSASTSPAQKVTISVPKYTEQTIEFIDITTGENVFTPIKRQILVGSQYKTVPFSAAGYEIIAPSNASGTVSTSAYGGKGYVYTGTATTRQGVVVNYKVTITADDGTASISAQSVYNGKTNDLLINDGKTSSKVATGIKPGKTVDIIIPPYESSTGTSTNGTTITLANNWKPNTRNIVYYYKQIISPISKNSNQTVVYQGAGDATPPDENQSYIFYGELNEATGAKEWSEDSYTYGDTDVPEVDGYYADMAVAPGQTVTPDNPDATVTVTYKPLGKIIPVDDEGNEISGAPTPTYNNDKTDPTKAATTKTPDIKGYRTEQVEVTPNNPGEDTKVTYTQIIDQKEVPTSQTVKYEGAGDQTPKSKKQDDFTFYKYTNEATGVVFWNVTNHTYDSVDTPVVDGYYANTAKVAGQTVTHDNPNVEVTVTYKPMGKIIPVDDEGNEISGAPTPTYNNDKTDPTKAATTKTPDIKGYRTEQVEVTPNNPGEDTKVTYTQIIDQKEVPTSQTVKYEGAGDQTPKSKKQDDFTFYKYTNEATGVVFWNVTNHTYDSVDTPVVDGYYANTAKVAGQTVTHDNPNVEVTVTYKPMGKIIPVDENHNPISGASTPTYNNDKIDPTKGTTTTVPDIPGYTTTVTEVTPNDPGANTEVVYTPAMKNASQATKLTVKYEGAGDKTPKDNIQNDYTFTGKTNEATGVTTWDEESHTYKPVPTPVIDGYYADVASVDNVVLTPDHPTAEVTVKYRALGRIVPVDPEGNVIPNAPMPTYNNDKTDPTKTTATPVPEIPGYTTKETSVTPTDPGANTKVVYTPAMKNASQATKLTVKYEGAGDKTPADNVQDDYTFTGKTNEVTGVTTWDEENHTYKPVPTPVIDGYYADVASVDNVVLTPDHPTAEVTVKYRELGRIVPVDPDGNVIPNAPMPTYNNDPNDPTKGTTTTVPDIPGYTTTVTEVTPDDPGSNTNVIYTPIITSASQATKLVVKYEGAGAKTPKDNIQDDYTFTGETNEATGVTTWDEESHTYKSVSTPVIDGYYADVASVDDTVVTPDNPNKVITVTYKPMGKIIPIDSAGKPIPGAETPTYNNDQKDPTKATTTETPNIKGYNKEKTSVTPDVPGGDTPVVYTPIISTNKVPSSQIINYVGAGDQTPKPSVQNDFTFTGETNEATGKTTWNAEEHTYNSVKTPAIPGYYADVANVDGAKVTPDNPTSITTVIYHRLGQIIPVDPDGNPIPNAPTPMYNNDPNDPTKGTTTPVPDIPGYTPKVTEVTPSDPGTNTNVIYTPIMKNVSQDTKLTVKYEGAGDQTPKDDVQNDFTFTGKTNEATGVTTWDEENHSYKAVKTPVIPGYYADVTSVDNIVLTPDHPTEEVTVKYRALGRIVPVDPEGNVIPNAPMPTYNNDPNDPTKGITTTVPDIPGYTPKVTEVTPSDPGTNTNVVYTPIINTVKVPTSQTVKYEGAGDQTPKDNVQNDFTFTGKTNEATGVTTWDEENHSYKPVKTPVIPGYYADVTSVDNIVLTPDHPTAEVTVKYRELGRIVPVDSEGNVIPNAPMPTYNNDPNDPTKGITTPVPEIPGYTTTVTEVTPNDPGANTQITYTPIMTKVSQTTSQVVKYEGAGDQTPAESIQNDYMFTGEKNEATGEVTWTEQNHSYQGVPTPVIPGYYADIEYVAGAEVTPDNPVSTTIVTYHKLGRLIPVDPNGNPIPNAPTPTYNNDPNNPTQGFDTPVPDIPGYKKTIENITPNDPGSDTKVVYVPIKSDGNGTTPSKPDNSTPAGPEQPSSANGNGTVTNENQTGNQSTTGSATANNGQNQSTQAQSLPQTGNDRQEAKGLISLGIASFLGMLGLTGYKKKQER
ncbi:YSIRK-type signal peptide-containing protein [Limosilactobacillus sp. WILCCON 0053]|uniref:mucin-binding protein n=1 Tax=Limosilactobacillus allomucosae TaxID=3142938 RepID=UPI003263F12F